MRPLLGDSLDEVSGMVDGVMVSMDDLVCHMATPRDGPRMAIHDVYVVLSCPRKLVLFASSTSFSAIIPSLLI